MKTKFIFCNEVKCSKQRTERTHILIPRKTSKSKEIFQQNKNKSSIEAKRTECEYGYWLAFTENVIDL